MTRCVASIAAFIALAVPAAVSASTVIVDGNSVNYVAGAGEANALTISAAPAGGAAVRFTDYGATIASGSQCVTLTAHIADCNGSITSATIDLGDSDDTLTLADNFPYLGGLPQPDVYGGGGNDDIDTRAAGLIRGGSISGGEGNDTISGAIYVYGDGGNDIMMWAYHEQGGEGDDVLYARPTVQADIGGGPGHDTVSLALELGGATYALPDDVEDVIGGPGNDVLIGNDGPNRLSGKAGDDYFDGGGGNDIYEGDPGFDTADYSGRTAPVTVTLDGLANDGNADDDVLGVRDRVDMDVEAVIGGSGDDQLLGSPRDDWLDGGTGADDIEGGLGEDTVDYSERTTAVAVTLDGVANDGNADDSANPLARDNVAPDIEDIVTGSGNDTLTGDDGDNVLDGGLGADVLDGGGGGHDTADYSSRGSDLILMIDGVANDGAEGEGDNILSTIDELIAGSGSDILAGGPGPNVLRGGDGNDLANYSWKTDDLLVRLDGTPVSGGASDGPAGARDVVGSDIEAVWGGSGNDQLIGNGSDNLLWGGPGHDDISGLGGLDAVDYSDAMSRVTLTLDDVMNDGRLGEDDNVHSDVEAAFGGYAGDTLTGNAGLNVFFGGDGGDALTGGAGGDALVGEAGDDALFSRDDASDYDSCGSGNDSVTADGRDQIDPDCERVAFETATTVITTPPVQQVAGVVARPLTLKVSVTRRQKLASVLRNGLRAGFSCSSACRIDASVSLSKAVAHKFKIATRQVVIGRAHKTMSNAGSGRLTVMLSKKARTRLRGARSVRLALTIKATPTTGKPVTTKRQVLLTSPRAAHAAANSARALQRIAALEDLREAARP